MFCLCYRLCSFYRMIFGTNRHTGSTSLCMIQIIRFRFIGAWVENFAGKFIKTLAIVWMPVVCWPTWLWLLLLIHRFVCCLYFHLFFSVYSNCYWAKCVICEANEQLDRIKLKREQRKYWVCDTYHVNQIIGIWCKAFPKYIEICSISNDHKEQRIHHTKTAY